MMITMPRSVLTVAHISMSQAGTYTCSPSMARQDEVTVTVKHRTAEHTLTTSTSTLELQTKFAEDYAKFYNHGDMKLGRQRNYHKGWEAIRLACPI